VSSEFFATEDTENKKLEIRSTKYETISKTECSNDQNEKEAGVAQINRDFGQKDTKGTADFTDFTDYADSAQINSHRGHRGTIGERRQNVEQRTRSYEQ
jgi:hypothetical protein